LVLATNFPKGNDNVIMVGSPLESPTSLLPKEDIIRTQYWELPLSSIDDWRPYTAILDKYLFDGPYIGSGHGLDLKKNLMGFWHGARGASKTLSLSFMLAREMRLGKNVWTNYPISFYVKEKDGLLNGKESRQFIPLSPCHWINLDSTLSYYESMQLDMDKFYTFSSELRHGAIGIDKLQYFVESRTSGRYQNRVLGYQIMQIRKTANSFFYTVQNPKWVDNRFGWSADFSVKVSDIAKANYDRSSIEHELKEGEYSRWLMRDLSGVLTGIQFEESNREIGPFQFDGYHFWEIYPTNFYIDAIEAMNSGNKDKGKNDKRDELVAAMENTANELLSEGKIQIESKRYWQRVEEKIGRPVSKSTGGDILSGFGVTKKQRTGGAWIYDFGAIIQSEEELKEEKGK
jgi:hypothetical protein